MNRFDTQNQFSSGTLVGIPSWQAPVELFSVQRGGSLEPTPSSSAREEGAGSHAPARPSSVFVGKGMPDPRRS